VNSCEIELFECTVTKSLLVEIQKSMLLLMLVLNSCLNEKSVKLQISGRLTHSQSQCNFQHVCEDHVLFV